MFMVSAPKTFCEVIKPGMEFSGIFPGTTRIDLKMIKKEG